MKRTLAAFLAFLLASGAALADENVSIRGNFPQQLAHGETTPQMANRIAVLLINLDRMVAPPCGMKRIFEFAGADHVDAEDLSVRTDPAQPGVWRLVVIGNPAHIISVNTDQHCPMMQLADRRAGTRRRHCRCRH